MPRTTRELLLRYADEAINDFERGLNRLKMISELYEPTHPEYCDAIDATAFTILSAFQLFKDFREKFM